MNAKEHNQGEYMKNKNEMCQKITMPIPAIVTARVVGCSESTVKKVRTRKRGTTGEVCRMVVLADDLLSMVVDKGIEEVAKVIKKHKGQ